MKGILDKAKSTGKNVSKRISTLFETPRSENLGDRNSPQLRRTHEEIKKREDEIDDDWILTPEEIKKTTKNPKELIDKLRGSDPKTKYQIVKELKVNMKYNSLPNKGLSIVDELFSILSQNTKNDKFDYIEIEIIRFIEDILARNDRENSVVEFSIHFYNYLKTLVKMGKIREKKELRVQSKRKKLENEVIEDLFLNVINRLIGFFMINETKSPTDVKKLAFPLIIDLISLNTKKFFKLIKQILTGFSVENFSENDIKKLLLVFRNININFDESEFDYEILFFKFYDNFKGEFINLMKIMCLNLHKNDLKYLYYLGKRDPVSIESYSSILISNLKQIFNENEKDINKKKFCFSYIVRIFSLLGLVNPVLAFRFHKEFIEYYDVFLKQKTLGNNINELSVYFFQYLGNIGYNLKSEVYTKNIVNYLVSLTDKKFDREIILLSLKQLSNICSIKPDTSKVIIQSIDEKRFLNDPSFKIRKNISKILMNKKESELNPDKKMLEMQRIIDNLSLKIAEMNLTIVKLNSKVNQFESKKKNVRN